MRSSKRMVGDRSRNRRHGTKLLRSVAALPGDLDLNGNVSDTDIIAMLPFYCVPGTYTQYEGDFNGDGVVNDTDLNTLLAFYGQQLWQWP